MAEELKRLQTQYGESDDANDIQEEDKGVYEAFSNEPTLFRYLPVIIPLL